MTARFPRAPLRNLGQQLARMALGAKTNIGCGLDQRAGVGPAGHRHGLASIH
jgi:hypothetical protein